MLFVRYLLLFTSWGLLAAAAINVFKNLYQVVQYHRQLRHIAPCSLSGLSSGPEGAPRSGQLRAPDTRRSLRVAGWEVMALPWKNRNRTGPLQNGRFLRPGCRSSLLLAFGGAQRDGWHQSEPDCRNASRHFVPACISLCRCSIQWCSITLATMH
jgi:hypothetical protein